MYVFVMNAEMVVCGNAGKVCSDISSWSVCLFVSSRASWQHEGTGIINF
jgi:hypothetical protein